MRKAVADTGPLFAAVDPVAQYTVWGNGVEISAARDTR